MSPDLQAPDALRRLAEAGDTAARTALAKRLLMGRGVPRDANAAAGLLAQAAQAGSGEAAAQIAVLVAAGARAIEDWFMALDYLQQSAEQGWPAARRQLILLASDREAAARAADRPSPEIWGTLRRSVRLRDWFAAPALERVSEAPDIRIAENFLPQAVCDWIIDRGRGLEVPARTFDRVTGAARIDPDRSNSAAMFDIVESDLVLLAIRSRICAATGFFTHQLEETNVLHYTVGQRFARHFDFLEPEAEGTADEIARMGQRAATFLIYLNEGFADGETDFPALGRRFKPGRGGALFFSNLDAARAPDRKTLHAGLAPSAGEKWLLSQWIREAVPPEAECAQS